MAKELTQTELVFSALKELGAASYTTRDIMSAMTKEELDRLKHDSKAVSKLLQNLEKSGRVKQAEKVRMGNITVSKWQVTNEVSTDQPVVSAETPREKDNFNYLEEREKQKSVQANFSFTAVKADTINSLIDEASCAAQMAVKSVMLSLQDKVDEISIKESGKTIADLDKKLKMLDDLSRTFSGSDYATLCTAVKADLESK